MGQQSLIIVLLASFMLSLSIGGYVGLWDRSTETSTNHFETEQAVSVSASGVNMAITKLRREKNWRTGFNAVSVAGGTCSVQIVDLGIDTVQIHSLGVIGPSRHISVVDVKLSSIFPMVTSALTVFGDSVDFTNIGKSFWIDGRDHLEDGSLGPYPAVDGIGVETADVQADVISDITANGVANLVTGRNPIASVGQFSNMDLQQLRDFYVNYATITLPPGSYASNENFGSMARPEIVHIPGDLEWKGVITGAGILIVDGELSFKGKIQWKGIIITLSGAVKIELAGTGTPILTGTVLVGNNDPTKVTNVNVTGNPQILYSYGVIQKVLANLNLLRVEIIKYYE